MNQLSNDSLLMIGETNGLAKATYNEVHRMNKKLEEQEKKISDATARISALEFSKNTMMYVINGVWGIAMIALSWFLGKH